MTEQQQEETKATTVEWILWEHKCGQHVRSELQWKQGTAEVCHFYHADPPFSCDLHHLPLPSSVFFLKDTKDDHNQHKAALMHTEYSLFKKGIFPDWGDARNAHGGLLYCRRYFSPQFLDHYWQSLVRGVMQGELDDSHINGVRVVDKSKGKHPLYKLEIWLDTTDAPIQNEVSSKAVEIMLKDEPEGRKHTLKLSWHEFPHHAGSDDDEQNDVSQQGHGSDTV